MNLGLFLLFLLLFRGFSDQVGFHSRVFGSFVHPVPAVHDEDRGRKDAEKKKGGEVHHEVRREADDGKCAHILPIQDIGKTAKTLRFA
jgi:hypothetical protein